jgi:hypothetical protein
MMKSKDTPAWLARRRYFRRFGRWVKPKVRTAEATMPAMATNVVPFPLAFRSNEA